MKVERHSTVGAATPGTRFLSQHNQTENGIPLAESQALHMNADWARLALSRYPPIRLRRLQQLSKECMARWAVAFEQLNRVLHIIQGAVCLNSPDVVCSDELLQFG